MLTSKNYEMQDRNSSVEENREPPTVTENTQNPIKGITTSISEEVTPEKAAQWLNQNTCNRKLRPGVVERYTRDMVEGAWTACADPIVFYDDGSIGNGQHRLYAIVESGTTQRFDIKRNFPKGAALNIDTGLGRTVVDNARIAQVDSTLTNELVACARAYCLGDRDKKAAQSPSEKVRLVEMGGAHVRFAVTCGLRGKFLRNSLVLAAIARAHAAGVEENTLLRFAHVLSTGHYDSSRSGEVTGVTLRTFLISKQRSAASAGVWKETFLQIQNAIKHFAAGKQLMSIRRVNEETYPLILKRRAIKRRR